MAKKSRNNRHKAMDKFTTNPTQYFPLCNSGKYERTYDRKSGFITVKNKGQDRVIGVFDYSKLSEYLGITNDRPEGSGHPVKFILNIWLIIKKSEGFRQPMKFILSD